MRDKNLSKIHFVVVGLAFAALAWLLFGGPALAAGADAGVVLPAWVVKAGDAGVDAAGASAPVMVDPNSPDIVSRLVGLVAKLAAGSEWGLLVAVGIMLVVNLLWRIKAIKDRLPRSALPWVSVGVGALTGFVVSWASGAVWWKALLNYVVYALAASGLYSAGGKKLLPSK